MSDVHEITGKCLCGAVSFRAVPEGPHLGACHCKMCRKWGSGPFLEVECGTSAQFQGQEHITVYDSSKWGERGFCAKCGSNLFFRIKESGSMGIAAGLIDNMDDFTMVAQVCVEEKPAYYNFAEQTRMLTCEEMFALFGDKASNGS